MSTTVKLPSGSDFSLELDLAHAIVPAQCKTKIMTTKVKMKVTISWCKQSWLSKCWHLLIKAWCWDSKKLSEDQNCTCTHSYTCCDIIFWQFTLKELQPQHNLYYCSTAEAIDVLYYCLLESTTPWLIHQCPPRSKNY